MGEFWEYLEDFWEILRKFLGVEWGLGRILVNTGIIQEDWNFGSILGNYGSGLGFFCEY